MFDVFLSHDSRDKAAVEAIANRLRDSGVEPFLDKWHLIPGEKWQPALEKALEASKTVAVFIGPSGISPWHHEEMRAALFTAVRTRDEYRVIPVLLPGADEKAFTGFLQQRTWVDFRSGLDKEEPFQRLLTGVKGVARASESGTLPDEPAPYRGLFKFEREHADRFFGREREVEVVLQKLERSSFVAIVGASGAGKSSLVLAGILPRLERLKSWASPITTFVLTPGARPLRALADRAVTLLPSADRLTWADKLEERMLQRTDGLRTAIETWTAERPGMLLLVVDQLEELFTHAAEKGGLAKVEAFAANLREVVEGGSGKLRVLATVRADFFDRCLRVEPLRVLLQDRDMLLGPMTTAGLRDAIVQPATAAGAYFETGVVSALLKELESRPVVLPLLEHALDLLWRARKGLWLTSAAYDAMGGLAGALKKHADECWKRLPEADRVVGRDIFLRLISLGEGVPDTRRRVKLEELYSVRTSREQVDRVVQTLSGSEARLLVVDRQEDEATAEVEVAHEILIQEWPTLRAWVEGTRRKLRIHRRLTEAAQEWADNNRAAGYLLTGARLLETEENFGPQREGLNQLEADFLNSSIEGREGAARREREAREARTRLLQRSLVAVGGLAVIAALAAGFAMAARGQAEQERRVAEQERRFARSRELAATALRELGADPQAALLLIQEAHRTAPTELVDDAFHKYRSRPGRGTFTGHSGTVLSATFSPDGQRLVTSGQDGTARIWDASSHKELAKLEGHSGWVHSAAFSLDGQRVVTASDDGTVRIWDTFSHKELAKLEGHSGRVVSAVFSPDGQRLVTAGDDGTARIWDASSHKELAKLEGHSKAVMSAAFSPDGQRLVTAGEDRTARIWDASSHRELAKLKGHSVWVRSAAFSSDGQRVVTSGGDGTVRIWNASSHKELAKLEGHSGAFRSAAFSPDGQRVVTASDDGIARLWDASSYKELAKLEGHPGPVMSAAFSPDGQRVVTAGYDGTARLWDASPHKEPAELEGHSETVRSAAFSPDGQRVVTASDDGIVRLWDASSHKELAKLEGHSGWVWSAAFSPDGQRVVTAGNDGTARLWDASSHKELAKFEGHSGWVGSADFSPDGQRVVTAGQDGMARIWDASSHKELAKLEGHSGQVGSASFSPDGQRVVSAGYDGTARIWDASSHKELAKLGGHSGEVNSAAFSPDGQRVVTAGQDGMARIWDASSHKELAKLEGHSGQVGSASFSPDGQRVVTAGYDGTARVWDASSHKELAKLEGHSGWVRSAAFSPDGQRVVTAGNDWIPRIWPSWMWEPAGAHLMSLDAGRSLTCAERRRFLHEDCRGDE